MRISQLRISARPRNCILRYNKMAFRATCRVNAVFSEWEHPSQAKKVQETNKFRYILAIALSLAAAVASGAIFLFSLIQQFALVEIAATLVTALQVFFLTSAIADLLERAKRPNPRRNSMVVLLTVFLIAFYSFTRYFR